MEPEPLDCASASVVYRFCLSRKKRRDQREVSFIEIQWISRQSDSTGYKSHDHELPTEHGCGLAVFEFCCFIGVYH